LGCAAREERRRGRNGRGGIGRHPFSGRWHASEERDGGVRSARGHVKEEGGLAMARARAGGPGHEHVWSDGGSPGTTAPGRARGRQGKREKRERVGEAGRWAGTWSESCLLVKERERGREWQVGPGLRLNVFKLVQKCSNLIQSKTDLLKLQKFELKYGF
jgi:hypothetical protein